MAKDPSAAAATPGFMAGLALKPAVIFEAVGVPGVIEQIMMKAPRAARIVVVGVCMEPDHFEPFFFGINKELNLQFVLGCSPRRKNSLPRCRTSARARYRSSRW